MVLTTLIDFDGQVGWLLLLLPLVVLALIAVVVIAGRDRTDPSIEPAAEPAPEHASAPSGATRTTTHAPPALPLKPAASDALARSPEPAAVPETLPETLKEPASNAIAARKTELLQAEQRFDDAAVARLSLELARDLLVGNASDAVVKSHLRRAIILASRLKDDDTHAAARLELGDIMANEQDLTSACEHWQIARQIFWDHGAKAQQAEVDQRMMANHCPTDWVLNDF